MKTYKVILAFLIVLFLIGCASQYNQTKMRYGLYTFEYQEKDYQIESFTPQKENGNNLLILKEGNKIVLKAIDKEQNGYIDKVLIGDISLGEARDIYSNGLEKCSQSGKMEMKRTEKSYWCEDVSSEYFLTTYRIDSDDIYNKFTIIRKFYMNKNKEIVIIDNLADGTLNEVIKGITTTEEYQDIYNNILSEGLTIGRVENVEGKYLVVKNK